MARRPTSRSRIRAPRRPVGVEWLEPRQVLASLVAVGSEIGATSQPFIKLVNAETGAVVAQTLAFESAFRGGVQAVMGDVDANGTQEIIAFSAHQDGVFTVGATADAAVKAAVMVEDVAATVFMALQLGIPEPIPPDAVERLHARYTTVYGQR